MTEFHSLECSYQTSVMILNKNLVPEKYYSKEGEKNPNEAQKRKILTKIKTFNISQQIILEHR